MTLRVVTDATAEPVSIAELKLHLRLSTVSTVEDSLLTGMEKAARTYAENYMKRPCLPQTFKKVMDSFPDEIILPRAPLSTNSTDVVITYLDAASGDSTTLSSTVYDIDVDAEPGRIFLRDGQEWPDHWTARNAVQVQFVAGFPLSSSGAAQCPDDIKAWIMMRVAAMYEHREPITIAQSNGLIEVPRSFVDGLLDRHVLIDVSPL